jgi:hypothetical protein
MHENDPLDLISKNEIDVELRRAKHIYLVLTDPDGGTCRIDVTHRSVEIWQDSAGIRNRIKEFNENLLEGAASGVVSIGVSVLFAVLPLVLAVCGFTLWSVSVPHVRHEIYATTAPIPNLDTPAWLNDYGTALLGFIWPISTFVGLVIAGIVLSSGCLRIWPQSLTLKSGVQLLFSIRATLFTREIAIAATVAVISAVATAVVTLFFARI